MRRLWELGQLWFRDVREGFPWLSFAPWRLGESPSLSFRCARRERCVNLFRVLHGKPAVLRTPGCPPCTLSQDFGREITKRGSRHARNARNGRKGAKVHEQETEPGQPITSLPLVHKTTRFHLPTPHSSPPHPRVRETGNMKLSCASRRKKTSVSSP